MLVSRELDAGYWALRFFFGLGALLAGLDKFTNILTNWSQYLSPVVQRILPVDTALFMKVVGGVEIVVGLAILAGATRIFGYLFALWLFAIAANLISTGRYYDIALRDILIGFGGYALARMSEARDFVVVVEHTDDARDLRRTA
jgi:uncharacterized membrane protein YphA (DoxX/SURF4 family)